jgi:heme/copper-type cytochrome/quinol oxidase subunit 2
MIFLLLTLACLLTHTPLPSYYALIQQDAMEMIAKGETNSRAGIALTVIVIIALIFTLTYTFLTMFAPSGGDDDDGGGDRRLMGLAGVFMSASMLR